jgi:hypothetical protein
LKAVNMICGNIMVMQEGAGYVLENPLTDERLTLNKDDLKALAEHIIQKDI